MVMKKERLVGKHEVAQAKLVCRELKKSIPETRVELDYDNALE